MADDGVQVDDRSAEKNEKGKIYLQLISSFIVNLTLFSAGLGFAWQTITSPQLKGSNLNVTDDKLYWITIGLTIGSCVGPIISLLLSDLIGRKWFLYLTSLPFIAHWVLVYLAHSWIEILAARLAIGISIGAVYTTVPVYLGELVETKIRGASVAMMPILFNLGCMFMYGVGPQLDRKNLALVCLVPTIAFLLTTPWLPESPHFYIKKGKEKAAALTLVWLRRKRDNCHELSKITELIKMAEHGGIKQLFKVAVHRKALSMLLMLLAAQKFCGLIVIQSYTNTVIKGINLPFNATIALLIVSTVSLVANLVSTCTIDRLGRKPMFLISSYGSTICLLLLGAYILLKEQKVVPSSYPWVPPVVILIYTAFYSLGLAPIPSVISAEIFPMNVKTWATTLANVYGFVLSLIVAVCYEPVINNSGYHIMFLVLGVIELVVSILASIFMLETSRKSFAEIQDILKCRNKPTKDSPRIKETE